MAIELVSMYGVNKNHNFIKLLNFSKSILYGIKVKEYRFHISIYHIFWELQFAELPECIAVSKLPGQDPVFRIRYGGTHDTGEQSRSLTETPERLRRFTKDH
jgi:hypothetical protein